MDAIWWAALVVLYLLGEHAIRVWDRASIRRYLTAQRERVLPPGDTGEKESE